MEWFAATATAKAGAGVFTATVTATWWTPAVTRRDASTVNILRTDTDNRYVWPEFKCICSQNSLFPILMVNKISSPKTTPGNFMHGILKMPPKIAHTQFRGPYYASLSISYISLPFLSFLLLNRKKIIYHWHWHKLRPWLIILGSGIFIYERKRQKLFCKKLLSHLMDVAPADLFRICQNVTEI